MLYIVNTLHYIHTYCLIKNIALCSVKNSVSIIMYFYVWYVKSLFYCFKISNFRYSTHANFTDQNTLNYQSHTTYILSI